MKIGFDLNGVLRDVLTKVESVYKKAYPNKDIIYPILPHKMFDSLTFDSEIEFTDFMNDNYLEIFGTSKEQYKGCINQFNDLCVYLKTKNIEPFIICKEVDRMIPSTFYFLSNNGCSPSKVIFVENNEDIWKEVDMLVTANHTFLSNKPEDKKSIKVSRYYNEEITNAEYNINEIKELFDIF